MKKCLAEYAGLLNTSPLPILFPRELHASPANLRGAGLGQRLQELARLIVARETDQVFEWTVQEPRSLEEGLEPEIIDTVRYRKSFDGVAEKEASIIQLGREILKKIK